MPGNPPDVEPQQAGLAILSLVLLAYSVLILQRVLLAVIAVTGLAIAYHVWVISVSVREIEATVRHEHADGGSGTTHGDEVRDRQSDW